MISASIVLLSDGLHAGWLSLAVPKLINGSYDVTLTADEASWLVTMFFIGSFVGDILAHLWIDRIGKRKVILYSGVPLTISWILIAAGSSAPYVFIAKFLSGMVNGVLFTTVPPFVSEVSVPKIKGFLGSTYSVGIVLGMLLLVTLQLH